MRRVVSLYLPSWPTDRLRRGLGASAPSVDAPLVLIGRDGRKRVVLALDAAARACGLRAGMAATQAQALVVGLTMLDADPVADTAALDQLALWALRRYAPIVAADPPDGLMIDIAGAAHLCGGERPMLIGMIERLAAIGVAARAAVAPTYGAAHAMARTIADPTAEAKDGLPGLLAPLPVATLRLSAETVDGLRRLGFDTIGELAAAPRASLALRFGPEPGRRLDQAFGRVEEPFELLVAPELIRVERKFAEPIGAPETLARYTGKLVEALCEALEAKALGARKLDLLFHRVDNRIEAVRVGTAKPVRDVKRLTRLLCDRIETVAPGFGIEAMSLAAPVAEPLDYRCGASSLVDAPVADISELIDTLANRVGDGVLYRVTPIASAVPERGLRRLAPLAPPGGTTWPAAWPRPSRLFSPPERVEAMALLPDRPPVAFTWRGQRRRVICADGPERIFGEWWTREGELSAVRDYFMVEDEAGERFWLFRSGDGEDSGTGSLAWFLHGIFG
ncbi:Y-family DNA polymerase [Sphingopyxis macrogoltabida]|uniref:DNA-directed DNA polymerase n=1 Tax=Sphingopyxis macrogoltabida TaxID=33050 RepID=A0AAC8Z1K3_SPHMC|nr:DNA polymerase Y family protein [Sphingopyxis macrogoltabida]ALJ12385.1 nucleotidyltransferase [Sphingopyxis macrogoltabida]AMU90134.1 nucleotidyltransferase [Sphingopyxis macrogoltabida]